MQKYQGCFVVYWPCGVHIYGAALDTGIYDPDTDAMVADAIRKGCKAEYVKDYESSRIMLEDCTCTTSL